MEETRSFEFVLGAAGIVASLLAVIAGSFLLGAKVKPRPPSYWAHGTLNPFTDDFVGEVDVTQELREPVQRLLNLTTRRECMGTGRDGAWASHKGFKVLRVLRIENGKLWSEYSRVKLAMERVDKALTFMQPQWRDYVQKTLEIIASVHAERELDNGVRAFIDSLRLDKTRNERLLFHGSPGKGARQQDTGMVLFPEEEFCPLHAIMKGGFDDRLGNVKGMYGSGVYFADMASKADQYAGRYNPPGTSSVGEKATLFLSRVVLGCPYRTNQSLEQLRRPPCIHGHFDLNLYWNEDVLIGKPWREKGVPFQVCDHPRFDSVMGDLVVDGKTKFYREFVVYDRQCYPEFCVTYERIT